MNSSFVLALFKTSILAQAAWTTTQDMKAGIGKIAGIIVMVSWLCAIILWIVGSTQKESNPAASKWCFYTCGMLAIGVPVVSLLFYMFVGASGTPTATF